MFGPRKKMLWFGTSTLHQWPTYLKVPCTPRPFFVGYICVTDTAQRFLPKVSITATHAQAAAHSNSWRRHTITDLSAHRCHTLKRYTTHTGIDPFPSCLSAQVHQGALQLYMPWQNAPTHFLLSLLTKALLSHSPVHCYYDNSITMPPNYQCIISVLVPPPPTAHREGSLILRSLSIGQVRTTDYWTAL